MVNGTELLETKKIILAGGSKVSKINVPGMESSLVMTSDDILEMNEVPESLVIIGGGVVGIELGRLPYDGSKARLSVVTASSGCGCGSAPRIFA